MEEVQVEVARGQPVGKSDVLEDILAFLKRFFRYCLCFLTCGCYPGPGGAIPGHLYRGQLLEDERTAVQNLLKYLDSPDSKRPTINDERLRALCILTYSDNDELNKSAALCFAELSDRMRSAVSEMVLEPLVLLLKCRDLHIQKAASLALSNFALNGPDSNKKAILNSHAVRPLIRLLSSESVEAQCNASGCITTLATTDQGREEIVLQGAVRPLLSLCKSCDGRVQRNVTGAILNLSHSQLNRNELVHKGALPALVEMLHTTDSDLHYYTAAALSNMAVVEKHRTMMVAIGHYDALKCLIQLLASPKTKVKCQACLALRNLASDNSNQMMIVKLQCLPLLHSVIKDTKDETLAAALALLRNLSIHKLNEVAIIQETFLSELPRIVRDGSNAQAQIHATGTIRNLAAGEHIHVITQSGCREALMEALLCEQTPVGVLEELTAALGVLADEDETKEELLKARDGEVFERLVSLAATSSEAEVCYNCAGVIGQITLTDIPAEALKKNKMNLVIYLAKLLKQSDSSYIHIALWTLSQLLKVSECKDLFTVPPLINRIEAIQKSGHTEAIKELAIAVLQKMSS